MKLSQGEKITLIATFGGVLLTGVIHIGIREWYQPDLRYEEGSYYRSSQVAVTSLKLENYGHSDAEEITLIAKFPQPIMEVTTSDVGIPFVTVAGGKGRTMISGSIPRLVPGQSLYVYFAINNPVGSAEVGSKGFISQIRYKGGQGKTGLPIWYVLGPGLLGAVMAGLLGLFVQLVERKGFPKHYERLGEAISFGLAARRENLNKDQFESQIADRFGKLSFRKRTVLEAARKAYEA